MAGRNVKMGLDYFPMDVNFFSDLKIRKLIKYQGGKAVFVYAYLLCNIYKEGYYIKWDDELPFMISEATGYDEAYIQEVLKCCFNIEVLSKNLFESHKIITSKGIQKRYNTICSLLKRKSIISEFNLINSGEIIINGAEIDISSEEIPINSELMQQRKEKESKRKKRKGNGSATLSPPSLDEVKDYFRQKGYNEKSATKAFDYYNESGWVDSKGNPVKNWKQKMIAVWFKDESKIPEQNVSSKSADFYKAIEVRGDRNGGCVFYDRRDPAFISGDEYQRFERKEIDLSHFDKPIPN